MANRDKYKASRVEFTRLSGAQAGYSMARCDSPLHGVWLGMPYALKGSEVTENMSKAIGLRYPREIKDAELSGRILAALALDGQVQSDDLRVFVEDGVVTLLGTVDTPFERSEAKRVALWVPGVKRVDDRLTVSIDQYLADDELLEGVQAALAAEPLAARHSIDAHIRHGAVTLRGRVDTLAEERAALEAAEKVKGVREVVSRLKVGQIEPTDQPVPMVDDATMLGEVMAAIADAGITIYDNESDVRDGVAHLRGLVDDRRALRHAVLAAWRVPGVQSVRNELTVRADASSRNADEALVGRIVRALSQDGRVSPAQVVPVATNGTVVLSGQVDSIEDHDAALSVTAGVPGVQKVLDNIIILGRFPHWGTDREGVRLRRTKPRRGGKQ
ncbi:MAG: BON domain-containing protein [Chloroflexota bacterium]|nr:MAG: BON domain-containing protein [Chloroflexota bacterium]